MNHDGNDGPVHDYDLYTFERPLNNQDSFEIHKHDWKDNTLKKFTKRLELYQPMLLETLQIWNHNDKIYSADFTTMTVRIFLKELNQYRILTHHRNSRESCKTVHKHVFLRREMYASDVLIIILIKCEITKVSSKSQKCEALCLWIGAYISAFRN